MKKLAFAMTCFALLTVAATGAWASAVQITLSSSATGSVVFTGTGSTPEVDFSFSGTCGTHSSCLSGNALLEPSATLGTYQIWMGGSLDTLTLTSPGNYTVGPTPIWLSVTFGGGTLTTQLMLTDVFGGTGKAPSFEGTFANATASGPAIPGFPNGVSGSVDFTVRLQGAPSIATLGSGATVQAFLSSGELVPSPEPSSLALVGTGVLGLAGAIRRKMKS